MAPALPRTLNPASRRAELQPSFAQLRPVADLMHDVPADREEPIIYHFRQTLPAGASARYVKVRATNAGPLPAWHPGAGGKAWIFADELVVR